MTVAADKKKEKPVEKKGPAAQKEDQKLEKAKDAKSAKNVLKDEKPQKPDKDSYEKRIEDVQKEIEKKKKDIADVIGSIDGKSEGKETYETERSALFEQLSAVKTKRTQLFEQKSELLAAGRAEREALFQSKNKMKEMEREGKDLNEETIERKIAELEYKHQVGACKSLKEEKALLKQIKDLKAQRPQAAKLTRDLERLKAGTSTEVGGGTAANRQEALDGANNSLDGLKKEADEISAKLDKLKASRDAKMGDVKPLIEKRTKLKEEVTNLIKKKKDIVEERKEAFDKWRQWENKVWEERKAREDAEWDKWRAEQAADEAKRELEQPNPFQDELTLLEQVLDYCTGLLHGDKKRIAEEEKREIEFNNPEGYTVMASKKDRDAVPWLAGSKGKKGKKGNILQGHREEETTRYVANKSIKHTADSLAIFSELKMKAPVNTADLPDLIDKLENKLDLCKAKVKSWEDERKDKLAKAQAEGAAASKKAASKEDEE